MHCAFKKAVAALAWGFILAGAAASAEDLSISGTVTDAKGGVVEGVSVTMRDPKGTPVEASTNATGEYKFEKLVPGPYELSFSRQRFQPVTRTLTLTDAPRTVSVSLDIGKATASIDVTDSADMSSGTRMAVSDRAVPSQVSVVTQDTLREQNINDLATALENVSGVTTQVQYGVYEWYTIGGFTQQSGNDFLLIDGMTMTGNRSATQLNNVERIEVIKGPSSILYGSSGSSSGGQINIIRKKPQARRTNELLYRTGRWGLQEVGGGGSGTAFGLDKLWYRGDVQMSNQDGWRGNGRNRLNASPALTWVINSRMRVTFAESFTRDRYLLDAGVPVALYNRTGFPLDRKLNPPEDYQKTRFWQNTITFVYQISDRMTLQNRFYHQKSLDRYLDAETMTFVPATNVVNRTELYFERHQRPTQDSVFLQGVHHFLGMKHNWQLGYDYSDMYQFTNRRGATPGSSQSLVIAPLVLDNWLQPGFGDPAAVPTSFPVTRRDFADNATNAEVAQDHIEVGESGRLAFNLYGRRTQWKRRTRNDTYDNSVFVSEGAIATGRDQTAYNYRAGASYALTKDLVAYFSSATNFQPINSSPNLIDNTQFKPMLTRSFEVGEKWLTMGGRLSIQAAASKKILFNLVVPISATVSEQAGRSSSKTLDFDMDGRLGRGFNVLAVYGYAAARYDDFRTSTTGVNSNFSGRRLQYSNRHTARMYLTKLFRVAPGMQITASLGARYMSPVVMTTAATQTYQGGWVRADGGVGVTTSKWDATVNVSNLLNRARYVVSQINSGGQLYPGAPFAATLTLRYRFN